MDKVLVTGASGFVCKEVLAQLIKNGYNLTAIGRTQPEKEVGFIKCDISDRDSLIKALEHKSSDTIFHIASLPGDTGNPFEMMDVNVIGCHNLLEYSRINKIKKFVLASSISAYEWYPATAFVPPLYLPVDEKHPCNPKDMYSTTKRIQELLSLTYFHQYKLNVSILRLTAVIGPGGKGGGRGWREIAEQMAEEKTVKIPYFTADEICHYVDIRDVARMFIQVSEHPDSAGEVFNCCGPGSIKGEEFSEIMIHTVPGIKVEYGFPWSMAQGGKISFDMEKASKMIDFKPKYTVKDSISNIKAWIDGGGLKEKRRDDKYTNGVDSSK